MAGSKYVVELTNVCNLDCPMCPRHHINMELGYMSMQLWHKIIGGIPKGSTVLPFWRGEASLHPNFREMISELGDYEVVLATNGTNVNPIIDSIQYLSTINVSIHNEDSYAGYCKIKSSATNSSKVIASMVEGEPKFLDDIRVYKRHTVGGIWGKVDGLIQTDRVREPCPKLLETVTTWDGEVGKCCHIWDTNISLDPYPDETCQKCDQWMGKGKTL